MKIFISWSGTSSRAVAEALHAWLPKVLQGIEPFLSAKDIHKGANWNVELTRELQDTGFGIVCLAPDNLLSPWLNYEAGAISKSVGSRVCPVLFSVKKDQVAPPMSNLQMTSLDREDIFLLMTSMNEAAGNLLDNASLREAVDMWWPKLEEKIREISSPTALSNPEPAPEPVQPQVELVDMIGEVLNRIRFLDHRIQGIDSHRSSRTIPPALLDDLVETANMLTHLAVESGDGRMIDAVGNLERPIDFLRSELTPRQGSGAARMREVLAREQRRPEEIAVKTDPNLERKLNTARHFKGEARPT